MIKQFFNLKNLLHLRAISSPSAKLKRVILQPTSLYHAQLSNRSSFQFTKLNYKSQYSQASSSTLSRGSQMKQDGSGHHKETNKEWKREETQNKSDTSEGINQSVSESSKKLKQEPPQQGYKNLEKESESKKEETHKKFDTVDTSLLNTLNLLNENLSKVSLKMESLNSTTEEKPIEKILYIIVSFFLAYILIEILFNGLNSSLSQTIGAGDDRIVTQMKAGDDRIITEMKAGNKLLKKQLKIGAAQNKHDNEKLATSILTGFAEMNKGNERLIAEMKDFKVEMKEANQRLITGMKEGNESFVKAISSIKLR